MVSVCILPRKGGVSVVRKVIKNPDQDYFNYGVFEEVLLVLEVVKDHQLKDPLAIHHWGIAFVEHVIIREIRLFADVAQKASRVTVLRSIANVCYIL